MGEKDQHDQQNRMKISPGDLGGALTMIAYGIGILSLINNLKREIPDITQPWYVGDSGSLGEFEILETYFDLLSHQGP